MYPAVITHDIVNNILWRPQSANELAKNCDGAFSYDAENKIKLSAREIHDSFSELSNRRRNTV